VVDCLLIILFVCLFVWLKQNRQLFDGDRAARGATLWEGLPGGTPWTGGNAGLAPYGLLFDNIHTPHISGPKK
jgi:hypothetical protein